MPPASVSSVRSADSISGRARSRLCSGLRHLPFVNSCGLPRPVARKRPEKATVNATLTILVLHPLTISRASRGREDILVRRVVLQVLLCRPASARSGRARGGACVRTAGARPPAACGRPSRSTEDQHRAARRRAAAPARHAAGGRRCRSDNPESSSSPSYGNPPGFGAGKTGFVSTNTKRRRRCEARDTAARSR